MQRIAAALAVLMISASASAQPIDWSQAEHVTVELSNFHILPGRINLRPGRPYVLEIANTGSGGHNFAAPGFFGAATIDPEDASHIVSGKIEVPKHQHMFIRLTSPPSGEYEVHCSHFMHVLFGMKGTISVQ